MQVLEGTPTIIESIFGVIGEVITEFANVVSSSVSSVTNMFYDSTNGNMTVLGTLLLIAVGAGLIFWAFRLIKGLVKRA